MVTALPLKWLDMGRALVPVRPMSKIPAMKEWASCPVRDRGALEQWPGHSWGWVLGPGDLVVDVDPRNGGAESLRRLNQMAGGAIFRKFPTVRTPRGGVHLYMAIPEGAGLRKSVPGWPGVDWLTEGSYCLMAGQRSEHGEYVPVPGCPPLDAPAPPAPGWLVDLCRRDAVVPTAGSREPLTASQLAGCLAQLPVADYREHGEWLAIMQACHDATAGAGLEAFTAWSTADPQYAGAAGEIAMRWRTLHAGRPGNVTAGTLIAEVMRRGGTVPPPSLVEAVASLPDVPPGTPEAVGANAGPPAPRVNDPASEVAELVLATEWPAGRVLHGADQQFWTFRGTHWTPLADNMVASVTQRAASAWKAANPKARIGVPGLMAGATTVLRARTACEEALHRVDAGRHVLNVRNGEIHIDPPSGQVRLRPHDPASRLTTVLATEYDPDATCPRFDSFLRELFSPMDPDTGAPAPVTDLDSVVMYLWELIGYTIQPRKDHAAWVLLTGGGANGKSTLVTIVTALLGDHAASGQIADLTGNDHGLSILPGKLLFVDEDLDQNFRLPDGFIKKVSENKMMTANPKHRTPYSFENTAIIWMACNSPPVTRDMSHGMMRRAHVIPFMRRFARAEQDRGLAKRIIATELPGILAGALRGLIRLRMRGQWDIPRTVSRATDLWMSHTNAVALWVSERMDTADARARVKLNDAYADYRQWSRDTGHDHMVTRHGFRQAMVDHGLMAKKSSGNYEMLRGKLDLGDLEEVPF
jgi:P4 family phage/plasmid primase-like protien